MSRAPRSVLVLVLALLAFLGCAAGAPIAEPPPIPAAATADDLLVVDCLLPGQVRKLGTQLTYLTARRPVKTSALDCEIRGGEYVAYDRANYQTALSVWLPSAERGDARAQNYVGEIFERGLGRSPDYTQAADWYRLAAKQDFAPAQINLGQLHERGLGVTHSVEEALGWYRRAAESEGVEWDLVLTPGPELAALQRNLARSNAEVESLRDEIGAVRGELSRLQQQRSDREAEADRARSVIEKERRGLAEERTRLALEHERIQAASAALARRRAEPEGVAPDPAVLAERSQALAARERELADRARHLDAGEAELSRRTLALETAARRGESRDIELEGARRELEARERALREQASQLARERSTLAQARGELEAIEVARESLESYGAKVGRRELALLRESERVESRARQLEVASAALEERQVEIRRMSEEIDRLRAAAEAHRQELAERSEPAVPMAGPTIQMIDPLVVATRDVRAAGPPRVRTASDVKQRVIVGRVDAPAGLLSVTVNDRAAEPDAHGLFKRRVVVPRDGAHVEIVAVDRRGSRSDLAFTLLPEDPAPEVAGDETPVRYVPPPELEFGRYFALVIGNDDYAHLPKLRSAVADARAVSQVLTRRYGFQVTTLEDATRYEILSALNRLTATLTKRDNLLLYYAGHGELDRINQVGHWLPIDAESDSSANWLSTRALTDELNRMKAKHVMVVADSCYSGALTRLGVTQLRTGETDDERMDWLRAQLALRVRMALTSGGLQPVLDSGRSQHSIFAQSFIEVLRGNGGILDGMSLYQAIAARVVAAAREQEFDQVPEYAPIRHGHHENGHFLFVPRG